MSNIDVLIQEFIALTLANYNARAKSDHKAANLHFRAADRCICKIKQCPDWVNMLTPLLEHDHISVRIRAASILLPYETKKAEQTLKKCRFLQSEDGFVAQMVLRQWRSGELKSPSYENGKVVYK